VFESYNSRRIHTLENEILRHRPDLEVGLKVMTMPRSAAEHFPLVFRYPWSRILPRGSVYDRLRSVPWVYTSIFLPSQAATESRGNFFW